MSAARPCDEGADMCQRSKQNSPPTIQSVIELRKGTTGRHNFQPLDFFFFPQSCWCLLIAPYACPLPWTPAPPSPKPCKDVVPWNKWPFCCRFHFLICGPVLFYVQRPEFSKVLLHSSSETAHHWMLLLSSVPFASDIFIFPMEWPTWFTPSLRGGMRSLMRSRPLASSKLVILCWGENPRIAEKYK